MRILDKYILKEFIGPFLFGVCAFTSVFVGTGTLYRIANLINQYGASIWAAFRVFVLAMRSGGQNFVRLAMPIFITAAIISLGTTAFNEYVVPKANNAYNTIINEEIKHKVAPASQDHVILKNVKGSDISSLMYARRYSADTKELTDITVQEFENDVLMRVEKADKAEWNGTKWVMHSGIIYDVSSPDGTQRTMHFKDQALPIKQDPKKINASQKKPDELTIRELRQQIKLLDENSVNTNKMKVEMYNRFALPLASLVCAIVGAPLGMQKQRGSSSIGFGISVVVIFIYYSIMTLGNALGNGGKIPPYLAAFLPDIVCGVVGTIMVYRKATR